MKELKIHRIEITTNYTEGKCPLQEDGRLLVDTDASAWLEADDFKVISNDWNDRIGKGELAIEIEIPDSPCRFLEVANGSAPACWGFGNAASGRPRWMESAPDNFAPDLVCLHCRLYAEGWEARRHSKAEIIDDHGYTWLLPELTRDELGARGGEIAHIDHDWTWLTVIEATEKFNLPTATIRYACAHGHIVGAEKQHGRWRMPQPRFLYWLHHRPKPGPKP